MLSQKHNKNYNTIRPVQHFKIFFFFERRMVLNIIFFAGIWKVDQSFHGKNNNTLMETRNYPPPVFHIQKSPVVFYRRIFVYRMFQFHLVYHPQDHKLYLH